MGGKNRKDWIQVVETAYALGEPVDRWLVRVARQTAPLVDAGFGVAAGIWRIEPPQFILEHAAGHGGATPERISRLSEALPWPTVERMLSYKSPARTTSEVVYSVDQAHPALIRQVTEGEDMLIVFCHSLKGEVLGIGAPLREPRGVRPSERLRLNQLAAHLGSGLRLRSSLGAINLNDGERTEAIFKPDGKLLDARGRAQPKSARQRLRDAVIQVDRARGPLRREDPVQALALWEALVEGRWSLVDHFDSDGSRYMVAVENAPGVRDPRGLTAMQWQVAEHLGQGRSAKEIGYAFGITVSAVNNAIGEVRQKLGLRSRVEIAAFFAPGGVRARLTRLDLDTDTLLVGNYGGVDRQNLSSLTPAEQAIALMLLQGATNQEIAKRRGSSYNTVANQVGSVYEKLGVTNRAELASRLSTKA